jgi:hypothetical protein
VKREMLSSADVRPFASFCIANEIYFSKMSQ